MDPTIFGVVFVVFFLLAFIEVFLIRHWNHAYFRHGLTVFSISRDIPIGSWRGPEPGEVTSAIEDSLGRSMLLHKFNDAEYGFREPVKRSLFRRSDNSSMMHGYASANLYEGKLRVCGRLNFVGLTLPFLFVCFFLLKEPDGETMGFPPFLPLFFVAVLTIIYGMQYIKFKRAAILVADQLSGASAARK